MGFWDTRTTLDYIGPCSGHVPPSSSISKPAPFSPNRSILGFDRRGKMVAPKNLKTLVFEDFDRQGKMVAPKNTKTCFLKVLAAGAK